MTGKWRTGNWRTGIWRTGKWQTACCWLTWNSTATRSLKEWLHSKTWVQQRYNIVQHYITAYIYVNVMFSCNDYNNVYALVDW